MMDYRQFARDVAHKKLYTTILVWKINYGYVVPLELSVVAMWYHLNYHL